MNVENLPAYPKKLTSGERLSLWRDIREMKFKPESGRS